MKTSIIDGQIPYTVNFAEALTVVHKGRFVFSNEQGRSLYAFIQVAEGSMEYSFADGTIRKVDRGQVIYIPKGARYYCTYLPEQTQAVIFQFDLACAAGEQPCIEPVLMPKAAGRLFRESTDQYSTFDCFRCAARIYDLLAFLRQKQLPMPKKYRRLLPAIELIERDPSKAMEVAHYAELCGMSEPGFRRSFKEYIGQSPVEYRNNLRLAYARKLIVSGEYSVEEAAQLSGFTNLSFFYRLFRRRFDVKPGSL